MPLTFLYLLINLKYLFDLFSEYLPPYHKLMLSHVHNMYLVQCHHNQHIKMWWPLTTWSLANSRAPHHGTFFVSILFVFLFVITKTNSILRRTQWDKMWEQTKKKPVKNLWISLSYPIFLKYFFKMIFIKWQWRFAERYGSV